MTRGIYKKIFFGLLIVSGLFWGLAKNMYAQGGPTDIGAVYTRQSSQAIQADKDKYVQLNTNIVNGLAQQNRSAGMDAAIRQWQAELTTLEKSLRSRLSNDAWRNFYNEQTPQPLPDTLSGDNIYNNGQVGTAYGTLTKKPGTDNVYTSSSGTLSEHEFTIKKTSAGYEVVADTHTRLNKTTETRTIEDRQIELEENARRAQQARDLGEEEVSFNCPSWLPRAMGGDGRPIGETIACSIAHISYFWILTTFNNLLGLFSYMFNEVLELTVVNMKATLGLDNNNNIINTGWTVFRDLTNILFIFVLIYAAIRTILFGTGDTGKTIATVIAVAVLINFSMFFTKVIVDISNTLSISFYQSMIDENGAVDKTDIIGQIVEKSSIASIVGHVKDQRQHATTPLNYTMIIKQSLIGTAFIIVLIGVLLVMSIMLLGRVIILGFIIMTSSLAVGSFIWPELKSKIFDKWFPALLGQSFFIPVFLLFLLLSIRFLNAFTINNTSGGASLANLVTTKGIAGAAQGTIQFVLVIGMLIVSLKIAKDMASKAGDGANKITGAIGTLTLGAIGLAGKLGLGGIGRGFQSLGERYDDDGFRHLGNFLANRTYDARNIPGMSYLSQQTNTGEAGTKLTMHDFLEEMEKNKKKSEDAAMKNIEKGHKDAGKLKPEQQLIVNINEKRKILNKSVYKIKADMEAKIDAIEEKVTNGSMSRADADKRIKNIQLSDGVELAKAEKDLNDHKDLHKQFKDDGVLESAAKDIIKDMRGKQTAFVKKLRSEAGKKFIVEESIRKEKQKNDTDELIAAIKSSQGNAGGGGGGNKKP